MPPAFDPQHVRQLIQDARDARAFPAAAIEVGRRHGVLWQEAFGTLSYQPDAAACTVATIFDLASLTKVIATASIVMRLVERGALQLETRVAEVLPAWRGADRETVTVRHLLDHSSGLPAHARLWEEVHGRTRYERAIAALALEREPGAASVYSDAGFMLLGFLIEAVTARTLDDLFVEIASQLDGAMLSPGSSVQSPVVTYNPAEDLRDRIAPTEFDPWRNRLIRGEVHDENAAALGGVAAHAGLFGDVSAVGSFARSVLETFERVTPLGSPSVMRTFATRTTVPGSTRALAWDTMKDTSSCGTRLSPTSIGHTGFTGTSLWIDRERDLYVAFLTNRVHPRRANTALAALRPRVHDAIVEALDQSVQSGVAGV
jgi:serine-type D-Ala-D-Ala carboxypeptidase